MMAGTDHPTKKDQDQFEIDRPLRQFARDEADSHQQIGAHAGGEEFERLLHPQVNHPPAPEIRDRERLLDPGEGDHAEHIKRRDVGGGSPDQMFEPDAAGPELPRCLPEQGAAGPQRTHDQKAPQRKADEETDLPETAKLDVRQALIAEPEPALVDHPHDAEIVSDQGSRDDEERGPEQNIDPDVLALRFLSTGNGGREKQRRPDP